MFIVWVEMRMRVNILGIVAFSNGGLTQPWVGVSGNAAPTDARAKAVKVLPKPAISVSGDRPSKHSVLRDRPAEPRM